MRRPQRRSRRVPMFEPLEQRQLLSADAGFLSPSDHDLWRESIAQVDSAVPHPTQDDTNGSIQDSADYHWWRQQSFSVGNINPTDWQSSTDTLEVDASLGAYDAQAWNLINLDDVRATYPFSGGGYSVAVIDTGIDYNHAALGGGWGNRVIAGWDFVNNDSNPMDDNGHGTHVAGIIGSSNATYSGVAPDVNLIALKVLGADGSGNFGAVEDALQWVITHQSQYNIVAVNLSLGAGNFATNPYTFLEDEFSTLIGQGVFIAAASGNSYYSYNSAQGLGYPAISNLTVSVGAVYDTNVGSVTWSSGARDFTTGPDRIASFTQRSDRLDILAPGAMITSTGRNNTYITMAGTSMATPVIAGSAVLIRQAMDTYGLGSFASQSFILGLMRATGVSLFDGDDENDNVANTGISFRRIDLFAALNSINTSKDPLVTPDRLGLFRAGQWTVNVGGGIGSTTGFGAFGTNGDQPFLGVAQGESYYGVFRNGYWYFDANRNGTWDGQDTYRIFGKAGDRAIVGDWNASGTDAIAVFRGGYWYLDANNSGSWDGSDLSYIFGKGGDIPVVGDWNADGRDNIGVFRNGYWYLDANGSNKWDNGDIASIFGRAGDRPVVGDWNNDGAADIGVFRAGVYYLDMNGNRGWDANDLIITVGSAHDTPVVGQWLVTSSQVPALPWTLAELPVLSEVELPTAQSLAPPVLVFDVREVSPPTANVESADVATPEKNMPTNAPIALVPQTASIDDAVTAWHNQEWECEPTPSTPSAMQTDPLLDDLLVSVRDFLA